MARFCTTAFGTALAALGLFVPAPSQSHPHVFADARLDVVIENGKMTALRHVWRFDELFTSTVLVEFDRNSDLKFDDAELNEVAGTVHESLADFGYFQLVTADGDDIAMMAPERLIADIHDDRLIILFESRPEHAPALTGKFAVGVYDPTFYTAIDFVEDSMMNVENMPASCSREVVRPDPEEAIAQNRQSLTQAFYDPTDRNDLSRIFATRLELTC